jgi:hypothetical protein
MDDNSLIHENIFNISAYQYGFLDFGLILHDVLEILTERDPSPKRAKERITHIVEGHLVDSG